MALKQSIISMCMCWEAASLDGRQDNVMTSAAVPDYLDSLNSNQREAVYHTGKPLLILAGAGSGKTRVITSKIAYMICEKNVRPWSILAVTFTNKAAREMSSRAAQIEPRAAESMMRTFHSFGAWFLRRNAGAAGLDANFTIYDDDDSVSLLNTVINKRKEDVRLFAHQIARAKDRNLNYNDDLSEINGSAEFCEIYRRYEERLRQTGNVDFGDLIKKTVETLRSQPELAERIRQRFSTIMVDEYQDANVAQFELLRELYTKDNYLCVVGDDDQSIYRFRGAEVRNILDFPALFNDADIIKLEHNYRSTREILELAGSVVEHNRGRHGKKLIAARGNGVKPQLFFVDNQESEAALCATLIKNTVKTAHYADWAVLYRTNAQSLGFEKEFLLRKIPYRIVGSLKFYEREEIKDALALLAFMLNPRDEVNFRRIINKPARGIGAVTIDKILDERWNEEGWNIEMTLRRIAPELSVKARQGAADFLTVLEEGRSVLETQQPVLPENTAVRFGEGLSICIATLIEKSGLAQWHKTRDEISGEQRLSNLQELVNTSVLYPASIEGVTAFLEHIELDRSLQEEKGDDRVTLITLHNTKGLEYKHVIMTGLEQGIFPRSDKKDSDLEEERRLFYVGATRAMDTLFLVSCAQRRMWGQTMFMEPSIFVHEANREYLDTVPLGSTAGFTSYNRQFTYTDGSSGKPARNCRS
ncbi:MAG: ATP-dependent helicase, partial [Spirochaetaceae bacterium]|nr:ATP-dependent helicase [Spirochaetaceae bacterium]